MKLGLIADIHEQLGPLSRALDCFRDEQVDRVVIVGDVVETGDRLNETCSLLAEANAVGVWGNHDFGISSDPGSDIRAKFSASTIDFMTSLRSHLEIDGCRIAHVEPWLNPHIISDLWYFEGPPEDSGQIAKIFNAVPHRVIFAGHYHRWMLVTPAGISDWTGRTPLRLNEGRYFVIMAALVDGHLATFDTETLEFTPLQC